MTQGYYYRKDRPNTPYRVIISILGKMTYIGCYQTPEEARAAYEKAREEYPCQPKNGGRKKGSKYLFKKEPIEKTKTQTPWTEEQEKKLWELYTTTDHSYAKIGEQLGKSRQRVDHKLREIRRNKFRNGVDGVVNKWTEEENALLLKTVEDSLKNGGTKTEAFRSLMPIFGRSMKNIRVHWEKCRLSK